MHHALGKNKTKLRSESANTSNAIGKSSSSKSEDSKPIVLSAILERVQIDLIDYSKKPDQNYKYVLHIKDHFSKYTALYACRDKTAAAVRGHFAH
jgi:hypothetical protein